MKPLAVKDIASTMAALLLFSAITPVTPVAGQDDDPLSYENTVTGYEAEQTRARLGEHFAGRWRVTLEDEGETTSGTALITKTGEANLILKGPEGEERYSAIQTDPVIYEEGSGPFTASVGLRFQRDNPEPTAPDGDTEDVELLTVPPAQKDLVISYQDETLALNLQWDDASRNRLRMQLATRDRLDRLSGLWAEESGSSIFSRGNASWLRGDIGIDSIVVLDELDDDATAYPFDREGNRIETRRNTRTLVVIGEGLPEFADGVQIESLSERINYLPDFAAGAEREQMISEAFAKAGLPEDVEKDGFLLTAHLSDGVTAGTKSLGIDGSPASWPLQFSSQVAMVQWVRDDDRVSDSFFPGEIVRIRVSLPEHVPMPNDVVGVTISRGSHQETVDGIVLARQLDPDSTDRQKYDAEYLSDPIHLVHETNASLRPPDDEQALSVPVDEGTVINAQVSDRAQLSAIPKVTSATVYGNPGQLGTLWKEALERVAACTAESVAATVDAPAGTDSESLYEMFQRQEPAEEFSNLILTELSSRSIDLDNGDHAAALLIRDEFVRQTRAMIPTMQRNAASPKRALALRREAMNSPKVAASPVWDAMEASFEQEGLLWDSTVTMPLRDTLDIPALATQLDLSENRAEALAVEETVKALKQLVARMQETLRWASDLGDCNLAELLVIAGHDVPGVVERILPRLLRLESDPDNQRQYWVADTAARAFVINLKTVGAAVRAQQAYSAADSNVAMAVATIATMGGAAALDGLGYGALATYVALAGDAVGLADGMRGLHSYHEGESTFERATGAAPVMGTGILDAASAARQNAYTTALGALLPALGAPGNLQRAGVPSLSELRHFRNVEQGRQVFNRLASLDEMASLSQTDQVAVVGYYTDLLENSRRVGIDNLSRVDQASMTAFEDFFRSADITPPASTRRGPAVGGDTFRSAVTERIPAEATPAVAPDTAGSATGNSTLMDATIAEPPPLDPRLDPTGRDLWDVVRSAPMDDSPPLPAVKNPVPDYSVTEPGSLSRHLTPAEVQKLFIPGRNLSSDEILQKADLIRSGRVPPDYGAGDPALAKTLRQHFEVEPLSPGVAEDGVSTRNLSNTDADANATLPMSARAVRDLMEVNAEPRYTEALDADVQRHKAAALRDLGDYVPGAADRLDKIRKIEGFLDAASPEELARIEVIQQRLQALGVDDMSALDHAAFFRARPKSFDGFSPAMVDAMTVIHGASLWGSRGISSLELAQTCNISPSAARAAIERARELRMVPTERFTIE